MPAKPKRRMWSRVNSQIFLWAGEEPLEIKFSGFRFKVPPRTETAISTETDPHSIYKFDSARDSKERRIPGSLLVKDVVKTAPNGGVHRIFDVAACCEYLQRDKEDLFDRGFAIVSDVNDIPDVMEELQPLYEASQDRRAHTILQVELERQAKMKEKGQIVTERENPEVVEWAMSHLARRGKTVQPAIGAEAIEAVLKGQYTGPVAEAPKAEPQADAPPPKKKVDNKQLYEECEEWGVRLTKREIEALLKNDEEQIEFITAKLRVKQEEASAESA